jgi:hypothetical protein
MALSTIRLPLAASIGVVMPGNSDFWPSIMSVRGRRHRCLIASETRCIRS